MDEEKVCSYCEEPIQGEDYRVLGDDEIYAAERRMYQLRLASIPD